MSADEEETFGLRPDDMNAIAEVISSAIAGVGDTDVDDIELELFKLLLTDVCTPLSCNRWRLVWNHSLL